MVKEKEAADHIVPNFAWALFRLLLPVDIASDRRLFIGGDRSIA